MLRWSGRDEGGDAHDTTTKRQCSVLKPMDRCSRIMVEVETRNLDPDSLHIELLTKVVMMLFFLHLCHSAEEGSLDGHSAVGDDARAGELATEVCVCGPFLKLVIGVTELLGCSIANGSARPVEQV
jgi:hypothetical protein